MTNTYLFTIDPGHAWLHVKRAQLQELGIAGKVSPYSYQRGQTVYLEEDCDAYLFIITMEAAGTPITMRRSYVKRTPIRSYEHYYQQ